MGFRGKCKDRLPIGGGATHGDIQYLGEDKQMLCSAEPISKLAVQGGNVFQQVVKDSFFNKSKHVRSKSGITIWEHGGKSYYLYSVFLAQANLMVQSVGGYSKGSWETDKGCVWLGGAGLISQGIGEDFLVFL